MGEKESILIIDDDEGIRKSLSLILDRKGYDTATAATGREALEKARERAYNVALLDIKLPDIEGTELLAPLRKICPDMAVLMITGYASLESAVRSSLEGALAYITKPLNLNSVLTAVRKACRKQPSAMKNQGRYEVAQQELAERKRAVEKSRQNSDKLQALMADITKAIAITLEMHDPYTFVHQQRVTQLACAIAREMGLSREVLEKIHVAGSLHDIGKMYVPVEILTKSGGLTEIEFDLIKAHPEAGYSVLKMIEFPWPIAEIVLQHHERLDGSGYPAGLSGDGILLEARILGVADVVEAIASHRPYRPALGIDKALKEISQNRGSLYDPEVVDACLKLFAEKRFKFSKVTRVNFKQSVRVKPTIISSSLPGPGSAAFL
jgi:putative two-component system response regulator